MKTRHQWKTKLRKAVDDMEPVALEGVLLEKQKELIKAEGYVRQGTNNRNGYNDNSIDLRKLRKEIAYIKTRLKA